MYASKLRTLSTLNTAGSCSNYEKDVNLHLTGKEQKEGFLSRARNRGSDSPQTELSMRTLKVQGSKAQHVSRAGVREACMGPLPIPRYMNQRGPERKGLGRRPGAGNREDDYKAYTLNRAASEPGSTFFRKNSWAVTCPSPRPPQTGD